MCQIQAAVAMEQQQTRLDISGTAAAGIVLAQEATLCVLIRTAYHNLIAGHLRYLQKIVKEGRSIKDLRRSSYKSFL